MLERDGGGGGVKDVLVGFDSAMSNFISGGGGKMLFGLYEFCG